MSNNKYKHDLVCLTGSAGLNMKPRPKCSTLIKRSCRMDHLHNPAMYNHTVKVERCLHKETVIPEQGSTITSHRRLYCGQATELNG